MEDRASVRCPMLMKRRGTDQMITDSRKPKQGPSPSDALPAVLPDVRMRNSNPANCGMQNCLHHQTTAASPVSCVLVQGVDPHRPHPATVDYTALHSPKVSYTQ